MRLRSVGGLAVEPLGDAWAVFDEASGDTHLLNDESMLILGLCERGVLEESAVVTAVASELDLPPDAVRDSVRGACDALMSAGLLAPA